jgi:geranylgeranyl reductase family protein
LFDLIVVGAGPAGASAARSAAKSGLKTLLLEKEQLPRNKLCGGGITPKVLTKLDFNLPRELIEYEANISRLHVRENVQSFEAKQPLVYMVSRAKFDSFLTEKAVEAGAEIRDQTPVRDIESAGSHMNVKTSDGNFEGKIVIGADGMGGPTARAGGFYDSWKSDQVVYAIESDVHVGEKGVEEFIGGKSCFDLYFGVSPAGYGWIFPKDDRLTVGVGCRLSRLRNGVELFNEFTGQVPELRTLDIPKPQAHLIPLGGAIKVRSSMDRMLLAGDSAGFAEPFFGEGIYFAIWGGQIAAQVANEACHLDRFDSETLGEYERRWRGAFGVDLDVALRVARMSYLEQYDMERVARFMLAERKVQECMFGLMDGSLRYRDVPMRIAWPYLKYRLARLGLPFYS